MGFFQCLGVQDMIAVPIYCCVRSEAEPCCCTGFGAPAPGAPAGASASALRDDEDLAAEVAAALKWLKRCDGASSSGGAGAGGGADVIGPAAAAVRSGGCSTGAGNGGLGSGCGGSDFADGGGAAATGMGSGSGGSSIADGSCSNSGGSTGSGRSGSNTAGTFAAVGGGGRFDLAAYAALLAGVRVPDPADTSPPSSQGGFATSCVTCVSESPGEEVEGVTAVGDALVRRVEEVWTRSVRITACIS